MLFLALYILALTLKSLVRKNRSYG